MFKILRSVPLVVIITIAYFVFDANAQYVEGPVASGAGGAGRAAAEDAEQIFLNPASIVHGSVFASSLFYSDGYRAKNEHDKWWGLSFVDNSEDIFFAGAYAFIKRRRTFENFNSLDEDYHHVSIGRAIRKFLAMGATLIYKRTDLQGGSQYDQWDGHLGFHYNPFPELGLGLVFYNIGGRDTDIPKPVQNIDKIGIGLNYIIMSEFRVRADLSQVQIDNPNSRWRYQIGFESKLADYVIARVGYDLNDLTHRKALTLGWTFDTPRAKFDYYYRKNQEYGAGALHGVDLRLPFW